MCLAWQVPGEATGDEDELGLAPVYKGSCVAKMLAREPGDEEKQRFSGWEVSCADAFLV